MLITPCSGRDLRKRIGHPVARWSCPPLDPDGAARKSGTFLREGAEEGKDRKRGQGEKKKERPWRGADRERWKKKKREKTAQERRGKRWEEERRDPAKAAPVSGPVRPSASRTVGDPRTGGHRRYDNRFKPRKWRLATCLAQGSDRAECRSAAHKTKLRLGPQGHPADTTASSCAPTSDRDRDRTNGKCGSPDLGTRGAPPAAPSRLRHQNGCPARRSTRAWWAPKSDRSRSAPLPPEQLRHAAPRAARGCQGHWHEKA